MTFQKMHLNRGCVEYILEIDVKECHTNEVEYGVERRIRIHVV